MQTNLLVEPHEKSVIPDIHQALTLVHNSPKANDEGTLSYYYVVSTPAFLSVGRKETTVSNRIMPETVLEQINILNLNTLNT